MTVFIAKMHVKITHGPVGLGVLLAIPRRSLPITEEIAVHIRHRLGFELQIDGEAAHRVG